MVSSYSTIADCSRSTFILNLTLFISSDSTPIVPSLDAIMFLTIYMPIGLFLSDFLFILAEGSPSRSRKFYDSTPSPWYLMLTTMKVSDLCCTIEALISTQPSVANLMRFLTKMIRTCLNLFSSPTRLGRLCWGQIFSVILLGYSSGRLNLLTNL